MSEEILISTSSIEPKLRSDFWREVIRPLYVTSAINDDGEGRLEGEIRSRRCGTMTIVQPSFNGQQYLRDKQLIHRSGLSEYSIQLVTAGNVVGEFPQKNELTAKPGDIFIADLGRPFRTRASAGARTIVTIPRESLERITGRSNLHGFVLKSEWPVTGMLADCLRGLAAVAGGLSNAESDSIQNALLILMGGAAAGRVMTSSSCPSEIHIVLRRRILEYMDQHIADPDLGPQKLMARFRISRTHLYRTFEAEGGIAALIREKRLDLAYQHLVSPPARKANHSIKSLSFRCGFSSLENFNRAFKDRFGVSPNNLRVSEDKPGVMREGKFYLHDHFKEYSSSYLKQMTGT